MLSLKWPKEHHFVWLLESARKSASKHKIDSCRVDKIATNAYLEFYEVGRWHTEISCEGEVLLLQHCIFLLTRALLGHSQDCLNNNRSNRSWSKLTTRISPSGDRIEWKLSEDIQNDDPHTSRFITMPTKQNFERLSCCLPFFQRLHLNNDLIAKLKDFKKLNQTHETSFLEKLRLRESVPMLAHANAIWINMISATA